MKRSPILFLLLLAVQAAILLQYLPLERQLTVRRVLTADYVAHPLATPPREVEPYMRPQRNVTTTYVSNRPECGGAWIAGRWGWRGHDWTWIPAHTPGPMPM